MKVFRLKDQLTGLYSRGGSRPRWSKRGKLWLGIGHVKNHINSLHHTIDTSSWYIEEYELAEKSITNITPVRTLS